MRSCVSVQVHVLFAFSMHGCVCKLQSVTARNPLRRHLAIYKVALVALFPNSFDSASSYQCPCLINFAVFSFNCHHCNAPMHLELTFCAPIRNSSSPFQCSTARCLADRTIWFNPVCPATFSLCGIFEAQCLYPCMLDRDSIESRIRD